MNDLNKSNDIDNEVVVIGANLTKKKHNNTKKNTRVKGYLILVGTVVLLTLLCLAYYLGRVTDNKETGEIYPEMEIEPSQISQDIVPVAQADGPLQFLTSTTDSINGVTMTLTALEGAKASVTFSLADSDSILLATAAADYRADNGDIVGEFIIDKTRMSRGGAKAGWCYVAPDGRILMGAGDADDVKQRALEEGGCFFRQYALVMDGQICPNILKGKAKRRALGFLDGKPVFVKTAERESVYDFSQALADYGFSHAIYLPGGEGRWILKTPDGTETIECEHPEQAKVSFLVFK